MHLLFKLFSGVHKAHHHIHLGITDFLWWDIFISQWNRVSMILPLLMASMELWKDVSSSFDCESLCLTQSLWIQLPRKRIRGAPVTVDDQSITWMKLLPIVLVSVM